MKPDEATATAATAATPSILDERTPDGPRRRLFVMRSGSRLFAVYADEVEATSENLTLTPLPFAPPSVRGVVSGRGRILTVIDPLILPLQPDTPADTQGHAPTGATVPLIVALTGDEQLALSVERVESNFELSDDEAGMAANQRNNPLRRIIRHHAESIALLAPAHLFDAVLQGIDRRRRRT